MASWLLIGGISCYEEQRKELPKLSQRRIEGKVSMAGSCFEELEAINAAIADTVPAMELH